MTDKLKPKKLSFVDENDKSQSRRSSLTSGDEKTKSLKHFSVTNQVFNKFDMRKTAEKVSGVVSKLDIKTGKFHYTVISKKYKKRNKTQ